jgi:hypothetical protein
VARNACVGERVDCRAAVDPHRRTAWQTYRKSSDFSALRSAARLCHPVPRFSAMSSANLPREEKGNHLLPWNCTCALSEASHARYPPQRNPWSLAYPSMTRSRNARVGRLYGLGRRRAARSPHAPVGEDLHEQPFPVWRSSSWPASKTNQCSLARHSRDQLRNVERMVMRPCPAAQKPSAVKRRAKRPSECAIVRH